MRPLKALLWMTTYSLETLLCMFQVSEWVQALGATRARCVGLGTGCNLLYTLPLIDRAGHAHRCPHPTSKLASENYVVVTPGTLAVALRTSILMPSTRAVRSRACHYVHLLCILERRLQPDQPGASQTGLYVRTPQPYPRHTRNIFQGWASRFNEGDVAAMCTAATQAGVSFYETSEAYGYEGRATNTSSECLICRHALTQEPAGRRVVVASKFFALPTNLNFLFGGGMRLGVRSLSEALDCTLERLGIDAVDVYQIHSPLPASSQQV